MNEKDNEHSDETARVIFAMEWDKAVSALKKGNKKNDAISKLALNRKSGSGVNFSYEI